MPLIIFLFNNSNNNNNRNIAPCATKKNGWHQDIGKHLGAPFVEPGDLKQAHWITLLRFAKTTKRFH